MAQSAAPQKKVRSDDVYLEHPPDFSLVLGGPLYQLLQRTHLTDDALGMISRRIIFITLFCWAPLLLASILDGGFLDPGVTVPFAKDVEVHVRFLIVVPLLIASEFVVHGRMRPLLAQFLERKLISEGDLPRFKHAIASAFRLRNSVTAEVTLIAIVYVVGILLVWRNYTMLTADTWYSLRVGEEWRATLAGHWFGYVSLPVFQFLLLRWYFRIFIWARFLWQVSRLDLQLIPTHPDRAGGLGFLSGTVFAFVPLLMAHGAMLAGLIASRIFHIGETLVDFKLEIALMVVFLICLVQTPLLVFMVQLDRAKRSGLREYGRLSQDYVRSFDRKWIRSNPSKGEALLGTADIQSLADLSNSYQTVQSMRVILVTRDSIVTFAGAILAPIIPLTLTMMPLEDLVKKLFGILF
ncbi:hypothetical protein [Aestuariivirga sp.]|uniref:hypothetical protein n=1 Tax=Aestuariivirga sp. TaxID=2650926 RepID=UPI003918FDB7